MAQNNAYKIDSGDEISHRRFTSLSNENTRQKKNSCRQVCCMQIVAVFIFALGLTSGILIGIYAYHGSPDESQSITVTCGGNTGQETSNKQTTTAASGSTSTARPVQKQPGECPRWKPVLDSRYEDFIFSPLTAEEMKKAANFLLQQNIVSTVDPPERLTQNFILYQYLLPPRKAEALAYLDSGGQKPKRFSKVTVQRGGVASPDIMEYKVGPLDVDIMTADALTLPGDIHFNSRPYESLELTAMTKLLGPDMQTLAPLISESFDGATYPEDIYIHFFNGPPSTTGIDRDTRWLVRFGGFQHPWDIDLIHVLPLSGRVHNPGTNTSAWFSYDFHYLNQGPFQTAQELMEAYNNNTIRKVKLENGFRNTIWDRIFPKRDNSKPLRDKADLHGARSYYPSGPRYEIRGTQVKWMGWNFEISGSQIRGPALFNINFKNQRIIYEHAVNDISLNYAMDSHSQNNIIYADATYGIMGGDTPSTVMSGVDCPEHGTVLNTTFWWHVTQKPYNMRTICIFEADGQEALWRHAGSSFEAGLRNRYLVVRVPTVIGNYDYTFETHFFLDGKISTYAKASGYIQTSFWDVENPNSPNGTRDAFGYRLSDYMTGPIHDHMFGFKVDFDILDKNNTFQIVKWKTGPVVDALKTQNPNITKAPEYFIYNETRYIEWEKIEREIGIQDPPEQQFWLVVNERHKNKWGVERGYQIAPLATGSQALKTHPLLKALSFTKYHCAVTKRKEEEQTLTSIYDVNRMDNPKHYFDKQLNNEFIVDDDIVNWVTVGFLHIPISEDMPMTVRVETGFLLKPFNFFDSTESFDMPQHTETQDGTLTEAEPIYEKCTEPKTEYCRFC